jgi:hypothetical protein
MELFELIKVTGSYWYINSLAGFQIAHGYTKDEAIDNAIKYVEDKIKYGDNEYCNFHLGVLRRLRI